MRIGVESKPAYVINDKPVEYPKWARGLVKKITDNPLNYFADTLIVVALGLTCGVGYSYYQNFVNTPNPLPLKCLMGCKICYLPTNYINITVTNTSVTITKQIGLQPYTLTNCDVIWYVKGAKIYTIKKG